MEYHSLISRQSTLVDVAQATICGDVEVLEPVEFNRTGAFRKFGIDGLVSFGHVHHRPGRGGVRLVDDFNAHQRFPIAITLGKTLEHTKHEFNLFRQLCPLAHAGDAAIVETVLAHRSGMQINKNRQTVFFSPVESLIKFINTPNERCSIAEDEIRYRNSYGIQSP